MDDLYKDRRLVELYDAVNPSREDFDLYLGQFPAPPCTVLDIGCGTGTFAIDLAGRGYTVTAVDRARLMIGAARAKTGAGAVRWVTGTVSDVPVTGHFDRAVMTGHAFQCLLHDDDIAGLFQSVAARLACGGSFWFETRNPAIRPWTSWTPKNTRPATCLADGRTVKVVHRVVEVDGEYVTFDEAYALGDEDMPLTSRSKLRFPSFQTIDDLSRANGLRVAGSYGDWSGAPLGKNSPEIILHLQKAE